MRSAEGKVLEHQSAFMEALRGGRQMRKRIFDTLEQHHTHDFGNSRLGPRLYEDLLSAVRESGAAEAVKEFESRFLPLVNTDPARDKAEADDDVSAELTKAVRATAARDRKRGNWIGVSVVLTITTLTALIIGFKGLKITPAEAGRSLFRMTASHTKPAPAPPAVTAQPAAEESSTAATSSPESISETTPEPVPAFSPEPELAGGE
jgi:hypothetical protein